MKLDVYEDKEIILSHHLDTHWNRRSCVGVSILDEPEDHSLYAYLTMFGAPAYSCPFGCNYSQSSG